jgi:two-component system LytT family response regulator
MERAKERIAQKTGRHRYSAVLNNIRYQNGRMEKIAVPTLEGIDFFNIDDIVYCESEGSYTRLMFIDKKTELVSRNLKEFEEMLGPSGFCRIHHSFVVNLKHVLRYIKGEGGYVLLTGGYNIAVSRRKKDRFLLMLNKV